MKVPKIVKDNKEIIIGSIVIAGGIYGFKKYNDWAEKQKTKKGVTNYGASTVQTPAGSLNLIETARQLGLDLGTAYSSWNVFQHYTENDDAIEATLKKIPKELFTKVALEYFKLYNRDLRADVQKNLDTANYKRVAYLFT